MTSETLVNLYKQMLYIRRVEERISEEYKNQEMRCPTHLSVGQEAIAVGVLARTVKEDIVFSTHRSHAHYLAKGGDLPSFISELYGKETGCSRGHGGSQHLLDLSVGFWGSTPIVGSTMPVAVGVALSLVLKQKDGVVFVFFGEAAVEEGVFSESLTFAALKRLPILFVCENNRYSTNTPVEDRQPPRQIATIAEALGVPSVSIDGNDVSAVYDQSQKMLMHIRARRGPFFLEAATYRTLQHCGPNIDPIGYRPEEEKRYWAKRDPLVITLPKIVDSKGVVADIANFEDETSKRIEKAFRYAKKSPPSRHPLTGEFVYAK